jgi:hypothetical protein
LLKNISNKQTVEVRSNKTGLYLLSRRLRGIAKGPTQCTNNDTAATGTTGGQLKPISKKRPRSIWLRGQYFTFCFDRSADRNQRTLWHNDGLADTQGPGSEAWVGTNNIAKALAVAIMTPRDRPKRITCTNGVGIAALCARGRW